ncbi:hypothetical protein AVEN_167692-1 [Araneus ventricosus]|uniref:DUF7041 domain-containing protein n=1 Tax=Araneus ventricosus TaxID=182803 RepID=A0A4Y2NLI8_ARAVE|nr:hypothetical protein AVEN_167692-1 [Araneus ventricosus]
MLEETDVLKSELARVAFRATLFWEINPDLWFIHLESQFKLSGISADETKFHAVVAGLDAKVISYISDIVRNPPRDSKYDALKSRILTHFSHSESSKLRLFLQDLQLGDKRPSQLLQDMRNLAAGNIDDDVLKSIFQRQCNKSYQSHMIS